MSTFSRYLSVVAAIFLAPQLSLSQEAVPQLINYQGKLTDPGGTALADGEYSVTFKLFDAPTAGALVWGELRTVTLVGGVFNVALGGSGSAAVDGAAVNDLGFAFGNAERYLEITIVSGPEGPIGKALLPRQQMTSVPYAISTRFAPSSGSIIMHHDYTGSAPVPRGWMICDGATIGQADYDALHGAGSWVLDGLDQSPLFGKRTPDLRDRYPVGASTLGWNGESAVPTEGNSNHQINLNHSHRVDAHNHRWLRQDSRGYAKDSYNSSGSQVDISDGQPNTGKRLVVNTAQGGATGTYYTNNSSPGTDSKLSSSQSIQPESVEVFYIIKL